MSPNSRSKCVAFDLPVTQLGKGGTRMRPSEDCPAVCIGHWRVSTAGGWGAGRVTAPSCYLTVPQAVTMSPGCRRENQEGSETKHGRVIHQCGTQVLLPKPHLLDWSLLQIDCQARPLHPGLLQHQPQILASIASSLGRDWDQGQGRMPSCQSTWGSGSAKDQGLGEGSEGSGSRRPHPAPTK
jgi:hypothetical protein